MKKLLLVIIFVFNYMFVEAQQTYNHLDTMVINNTANNYLLNANLGYIPLLEMEKDLLTHFCKTRKDTLNFLLNRKTHILINMNFSFNDSLDGIHLINLINLQRTNSLIYLSIICDDSLLTYNQIINKLYKKYHITNKSNLMITNMSKFDYKFKLHHINNYNLADNNFCNCFTEEYIRTNDYNDLMDKLSYIIFCRDVIQPTMMETLEYDLFLSLTYYKIITIK